MPVAMVTGASRGIGAACVRKAAAAGYDVCLNYLRSSEKAESLCQEVSALGCKAIAVAADVAVEDQILLMFQRCQKELGVPSLLVNNAGILEHHMRLESMTVDRLKRVFDTNIVGSFVCAREAVKCMSTKLGGVGGSIVNISSAAARLGSPNEYIDYAASKGAIDTMTMGLAKEVAECGIRVNAIRPGIIYTDIHASGGEPDRIERVKGAVPMQRGGTAEEVAEAVIWLASEKSSYCTGSFIDVSGGR